MSPKAKKSSSSQTSGAITHAEALERGYFGVNPDPHANEEYALTTGPDSPSGPAPHALNQLEEKE